MRLSIIAVFSNFHIKRLGSYLEPHKYLGFELARCTTITVQQSHDNTTTS